MRHVLWVLLISVIVPSSAFADSSGVDRRFAIASDPIRWLSSSYSLSASFVIADHVAIRADGQHAPHMWSASLGLPIYFDHALRGPFVEPGVGIRRYDSTVFAVFGPPPGLGMLGTSSGYPHELGPQIFVGWQWMFPSGIHLTAALGAARAAPEAVVPESYLRLGCAF